VPQVAQRHSAGVNAITEYPTLLRRAPEQEGLHGASRRRDYAEAGHRL